MSLFADHDLSSILPDDLFSMDLFAGVDADATRENQSQRQPISKRQKPTLKCVVCGDSAFGKVNVCSSVFAMLCVICRIQFRCRLLRIVQGVLSSKCTAATGKMNFLRGADRRAKGRIGYNPFERRQF